jgi:hypothetical protein
VSNPTSPQLLQAPTPLMLKDESAHYRFLLALYNRTGGPSSTMADLSGLTASVKELNTLEGVKLGTTVQQQLNTKVKGTVITNNTTPTFFSITPFVPTNVIDQDFKSYGNVLGVETNLALYALVSNTLVDDNAFLEVIGFGSFAANANSKRIKVFFGGTVIYDSLPLVLNGGFWKIYCIISRINSNIQKCVTESNSNNNVLPKNVIYVQATEDLTNLVNIVFTGTGASDNDIIQEGLIVKYYKG